MTRMPLDTLWLMLVGVDPRILEYGPWRHAFDQCPSSGASYRDEWRWKFKYKKRVQFSLVFRTQHRYLHHLENCLWIEISSLPKVLSPCNHGVVEDWDATLDRVNEILRAALGPAFQEDIRTGMVVRIDPSAGVQVEGSVQDYIIAAKRHGYARREQLPYLDEDRRNTGVIHKPRKENISFMLYWIYRRCTHNTAQQLLKVEISIRSKHLVTERLGKKDLTVGELTPDPLWDLLEAGLIAVGLDLEVVGDRLEMEQRLAAHYSPVRVRTLLGYAVQRQSRSREQIIKETKNRQTVSRLEDAFKDAGIASFDMQGKVHLPAVLPLLQALRNCDDPPHAFDV